MSTPLKSSESLQVDTPKDGSKGLKSPPMASSTPAKGGGKSQVHMLWRKFIHFKLHFCAVDKIAIIIIFIAAGLSLKRRSGEVHQETGTAINKDQSPLRGWVLSSL